MENSINIGCKNIGEFYEGYSYKPYQHPQSRSKLRQTWEESQDEIQLARICESSDSNKALRKYNELVKERKNNVKVRNDVELYYYEL